MQDVYIYDAIRTPRTRAKADGGLHDLRPHDLLQCLYQALEQRTGLNPERVAEVVLGCVTQYGEQAGNIAKTSTLYAGWPSSVGGLTVNRFCSSGIDAIAIAALKITAGQEQAIVAGGVEMMSRVPMLSDKAAAFIDPVFAAQCHMLMMGSGADLIASLYEVTREQADKVALLSQQRAAHARSKGYFKSLVPVNNCHKDITVSEDECIRASTNMESLAQMSPAFTDIGSQGVDALQLASHPQLTAIQHIHTAGNSPAMADGAALVLLGDESLGDHLDCLPRARIIDSVSVSDDPMQVLAGCVSATRKLMERQQLATDAVDLFELHEAFAATVLKSQQDLGISTDKLNVNGGVIALGHPMGATGAIMAGTLLDELERRGKQRGIVAASGAAGAGAALLLELV